MSEFLFFILEFSLHLQCSNTGRNNIREKMNKVQNLSIIHKLALYIETYERVDRVAAINTVVSMDGTLPLRINSCDSNRQWRHNESNLRMFRI